MVGVSAVSLTSRVVASVLQPLQTFDEDLKDLTASPRHMVVEIGKDSWGQRENVTKKSNSVNA